MQRCFLAFVLLASAFSFGTTTITGNLKNPATGVVASRSYVRFNIRNCGGNQPRITGTGVLVPNFYDFAPNGSGIISGSLYNNSDEISCGTTTNTWYGVVIYQDGKAGPEVPYVLSGGTFNLNSATPLSTAPSASYLPNSVVTNPTGDQTIAQPTNTSLLVNAGRVDFTAAQESMPFKADTSANTPSSCTANKAFYVKTDGTSGQNLFICNSTGTGYTSIGSTPTTLPGLSSSRSTAGSPLADFWSSNDTVVELAGSSDGTGTVSVGKSGSMTNAGMTSSGTWTLSQMATPGTPSVTPTGGAAGAYTYAVVAKAGTGTTLGSLGSTAVGPTTLGVSNYNTITWSAVAGTPSSYDVYRTVGGATQGKIGNVLSTATLSLVDNGLVGDGTSTPSTNTTGILTAYQVSTTGPTVIDGTEASAPASPASSHWVLYPKTTTGWCQKNSSGTETCINDTVLTTKGDLYTFSTLNARLAVGTDKQVLTADSSQATGLKWSNPAAALLYGFCSGTSTSSTTLSIGGSFGGTSTACTGSSVTRAVRVGSAGVLRNLNVVSDAGFNASSGVFTVYVCTVANQVACASLTTSSISCTVGTGQSCSDTSSTQSVAAGDAVIVKYTTQATETLGNIMVSLEKTVN